MFNIGDIIYEFHSVKVCFKMEDALEIFVLVVSQGKVIKSVWALIT